MPMSNSTPNLVKISETTAEIWWFSFFQDGDRPTSWIFIQVKNGRCGTLQTVHVYHHAKFGDNSSNGGRVIAIFRFSKWRPAAILDYALAQKWHYGTLRAGHGHQHTKFGEYILWRFSFFQNGGRPPSWIWSNRLTGPPTMAPWRS